MEARRENTRSQNYQKKMFKQAKDLAKKQELEDIKNQAIDMTLGKVLPNGTEFA